MNRALSGLSQTVSHCITFSHRHLVKFVAKLGVGELLELITKALKNADHEVFLTGFQFVSVTFQEDQVLHRDGSWG